MDIDQLQFGLPDSFNIPAMSAGKRASSGIENFGNVLSNQLNKLADEHKSPLIIAVEHALSSNDINNADKAVLNDFVSFLHMQELRSINGEIPQPKGSCDKDELIERIKQGIISGNITPEQAVELMFMLTFLGMLEPEDIEELMTYIESSEVSEETASDESVSVDVSIAQLNMLSVSMNENSAE
ncbi:hypothetical protein HOH45_09000 [bacterium]|jgi:hypothetical protein|nr:hypothetical protein [bacterium]